MIPIATSFLSQCNGDSIAYKHYSGEGPGIIFCPGFQSTMMGNKSKSLFEWCQISSHEFTCFDYYGHGESKSSSFDGRKQTIERWKNDLLEVIDMIPTSSQQILVGSSMGGWLMMLAALERPERISGLVGIASAPDFTRILAKEIGECDKLTEQMKMFGYSDIPTEYGGGHYRIYKELLGDDGEYLLFQENDTCKCQHLEIPIRLIHGKKDCDISWEYSQKLYDLIQYDDKELILLEDGDHRLSSSHHIDTIIRTVEELLS